MDLQAGAVNPPPRMEPGSIDDSPGGRPTPPGGYVGHGGHFNETMDNDGDGVDVCGIVRPGKSTVRRRSMSQRTVSASISRFLTKMRPGGLPTIGLPSGLIAGTSSTMMSLEMGHLKLSRNSRVATISLVRPPHLPRQHFVRILMMMY